MIFAEISDVVFQAVIAGVVTMVLAYFQYLTKTSVDKSIVDNAHVAGVTAKKVEQVAATLTNANAATADKLDGIANVSNATHTLVNSRMGVQLKIGAHALRRIADMTKDRDDEKAADDAEKLLKEHEKKQAEVDSMPGQTADDMKQHVGEAVDALAKKVVRDAQSEPPNK